jgi:hypothetical protein
MLRLALALVLIPSFALAAAPEALVVDRSTPAMSRTTAADWMRHPHDDKYYTENWTACMRSKDGNVAFVQILYSNIGVLSGSAAVHVAFTPAGSTASHHVFEHSLSEYGQDEGSGRVGVGASWMGLKGDSLTIRIKEKDVEMTLDATTWYPGYKLHDGVIRFGKDSDKFVQTFFAVPRATMTGTAVVSGKKYVMDGDVYVDHFVQNVIGTDYATHWWTNRFFHPDYTVFFIVFRTTKDYGNKRVVRFFVGDRKSALHFGDSLTLATSAAWSDPKGHKHDSKYSFSWSGKKLQVKGELSGKRMFDRDAILDQMNAAQRQVVKIFAGNPVIYRIDGEADIGLSISGSPEVRLQGSAVMESIVLGGE